MAWESLSLARFCGIAEAQDREQETNSIWVTFMSYITTSAVVAVILLAFVFYRRHHMRLSSLSIFDFTKSQQQSLVFEFLLLAKTVFY